MDFNTINKIIDSFQKRPRRTILIISLVAVFAIIGVVFGGYLSELGKKFATDNGTISKAEPSIQIGEVKTGDQSQVYVGSKVIISGVSPKVVTELSKTLNLKVIERLLKTLDEKDVAIEERDAKLQELSQKYKELEERLARRSVEDKLADQAKQKLEEGNLEGAEQILLISLDKNLQAKAEKMKAAAADAFELGLVKELQLDYAGAKKFYEQAVQLEKALASNRKAKYKDQPSIPPPKSSIKSIGIKFVLIPAGSFTMGSPPGEPGRASDEKQHEVTISKPFYLQTTEVTQGQWKRIMGYNPSFFKECGDECPVEAVSWKDTQKFIKRLNQMEGADKYRLPTEAEWEYACRATTTTPFSTGECIFTDQANYNGNFPGEYCPKGEHRKKTLKVGSFQPNDWGLYDMHGNVWEWVQDWYNVYPLDWVDDPKGPPIGASRVFRGGGWYSNARYCRSAFRRGLSPGMSNTALGFRLARSFALGP